jgi:hypothetical protein
VRITQRQEGAKLAAAGGERPLEGIFGDVHGQARAVADGLTASGGRDDMGDALVQ